MLSTMISPPAVSSYVSTRRASGASNQLCAPFRESCPLLFVGKVFGVVEGTIAAGLQSETMVCRVEEDPL